jgi:hypothetical protein
MVVLGAEGCSGRAKGRKAPAGPSVMVVLRFRWPCDRALKSRPWKARGVPHFVSAKPARGVRGPGFATPVRQPGGCRTTSWGDIHVPEALPLRSLPQPIGAGSSRPLNPPCAGPCRTKDRCLGCKGEKPWHLRPGSRPRERPSREENPTANDDATPRRKRVWWMEAVE